MIVIASVNHKGGVGKSTVAVNLAAGLALRERKKNPPAPGKILLIDLDPTASALYSMNPEKMYAPAAKSIYALLHDDPPPSPQTLIRKSAYHDNLYFIPTNTESLYDLIREGFTGVRHKERRLALALRLLNPNLFKYVIVDTPPLGGYMFDNAMLASNFIVIPVTTEFLGEVGLKELFDDIRKLEFGYEGQVAKIAGYIPMMVETGRAGSREYSDQLKTNFGSHMILQEIHAAADVKLAHDTHTDVFTLYPGRKGAEQLGSAANRTTREFAILVDQIVQRVEVVHEPK